MAKYDDKSVFIPGKGAVLIGAVGAEMPALEEVERWVKAGATGDLGTMEPLGYTSVEDLPSFDVDTDGGEERRVGE